MDLTREILVCSDLPVYRDNSVVCFNIDSTNEVWNMGIGKIEDWRTDKYAIGVWKIKQLKQ